MFSLDSTQGSIRDEVLVLSIQTIEDGFDKFSALCIHRILDVAEEVKPVDGIVVALTIGLLVSLILKLLQEQPVLSECLLKALQRDKASELLVVFIEGLVEGTEVRRMPIPTEVEPQLEVEFIDLSIQFDPKERHDKFYFYN